MFNFFSKSKIECPRCLGKGNVDWDDIKRLGQELRWVTGKCAYCNGKGRISAKMAANVAADNSYLTTDIGKDERQRLFLRDESTLQRARQFNSQVDLAIAQIEYLYFMGKMDAEAIADFFLIARSGEDISADERHELIDYVERVISKKTK